MPATPSARRTTAQPQQPQPLAGVPMRDLLAACAAAAAVSTPPRAPEPRPAEDHREAAKDHREAA
ncbi:hypothetical protein [Streptomyces griseoloalbus]|uniref:Uncharacterized protein n=1 Tax=Streptomyces griseoloalbus TaxID=67303 RepID=A0A7W8F5P6_9ACTN|nr:hypothetical protein [Streptomyces albaduncus]MBB5124143.1 hypothetical protein [Streptomyces albaduncus]GGV84148.1 hypothetical protein GCM10010294_61880 [Streptomyces griseoloalbus]GGW32909.1 hypothetical protein GCM10010340_08240 [Streptomyces albaduncus]